MYETEANREVEIIRQIPSEVVKEFRDFREKIVSRTLLPWGEHCTECIWPTCYTTCDLYSPRDDGRCRRFVDGMVRLECPGAVNSYLLKIRFKRWGKLWAPGNIRLFSIPEADRLEQRDHRIGSALVQLPLPGRVRNFATGKRYSWKKRLAASAQSSFHTPKLFIIECYNPGENIVSLSLTMRASTDQTVIPYQRLFEISPGFHRESIQVDEISRRLDLSAPFSVDLIPNDITDGTTLYFGLIDFVDSKPQPMTRTESKSRVKCIVWDLDNTLWDGILVEDGCEKVILKAGIGKIIEDLDRRGILHSIASKNNFNEAMSVLKSQGLEDYFLYPQISWGPKSEALITIARKLNIGIDTVMFVDDSEFELAEVKSAFPVVQTLPADRYEELPLLPSCQGQVTEESANRRKMYRQEAVRESSAASFGGNYLAFLRECKMEMEIEPLSQVNMERVHELTQRTNQMNFSGSRYERTLLAQIADSKDLETYVISCRDRFGSYGIVGFSVVDTSEPRLTDLMFSCRIQAKRVEHAFLTYLLRKYLRATGVNFWANYRKTPRNAPAGRVFQDIGMEEIDEKEGVTSLVFRNGREIPDDQVVEVVEATHGSAGGR